MKQIMVLLIVLFLTSCATERIKPSVDTIEVQGRIKTIPINPPDIPASVIWKEFEWTVLTPEIMEDLLIKHKKGEIEESDMVFYAISTKGYENLSVNMSEIIRYLEQQKAVIMYYKDTVPSVIAIPPENNNEE